MKKVLLTIITFAVGTTMLSANNLHDTLLLHEKRLVEIELKNARLEQHNNVLQQKIETLERELTRLDQKNLDIATKTDGNKRDINKLAESMKIQLTETNATIEENVAEVNKGVKNRSLLGIIIAMLLAVLTAALFLLLRRLIAKKSDDIELLRARADDLNRQMVEKMDKELTELQIIATAANTSVAATSNNDTEPDHSLVKALADRITFMEMTLYRMDPSVKGHKQLTKSIKNMKDNLMANGYELVDMLGKEYVEGMKLSASFISDDSIEEGKQIITGIVKPQINFKGKMIQAAQITVSQNI